MGILCGGADGIGSKADPLCYQPLSCPQGLSVGKGHGNSWRFSVGCKLQCWLRWETPCCSSGHQQMSWDILSLDGAERAQGRARGWDVPSNYFFFSHEITEWFGKDLEYHPVPIPCSQPVSRVEELHPLEQNCGLLDLLQHLHILLMLDPRAG